MIFKERKVPRELQIYRMLRQRMSVDDTHYWNLEKGFQGEVKFDRWLDSWKLDEWFVVNDLLLEHSRNVFQLDSLILTKDRIYLFDVKNFEGDFLIEGDRWLTATRKEITNPLIQLNRCETMLRKLLTDFGYNLPIESNLIFVNPAFQLYNCPPDFPIIFQSQMERFKRKIQIDNSGVCSPRQMRLAERLVQSNIEESPYERLPQYEFGRLRKGVFCVECGGECFKVSKYYVRCFRCEKTEQIEVAINRSIKEYLTLFPQNSLRSKIIYEWCGKVISQKAIVRLLKKSYNKVGYGRSSSYVEK